MRVILQQVVADSEVTLEEPLVNKNYLELGITIMLKIQYATGEATDAHWNEKELDTKNNREMEIPQQMSRLKPISTTEFSLFKPQNFELHITVHEARQLAGVNIDSVVYLEIDDMKKHTTTQKSTNSPIFAEDFVYEFFEPPDALMDKILHISVYCPNKIPFKKTLIGTFRIDIATIYDQQDHTFRNKWAVLIDPQDISATIKGYVKCDVAITQKGDTVETSVGSNYPSCIEENLMLPKGFPASRPWAFFFVKIYKAEGLPKMNSGIVSKLIGEDKVFIDPKVAVVFADQQGQTSVVKSSANPVWNEQIIFMQLFPALCRRILIQVQDEANLGDTVLATHFINLKQISDNRPEGFLPVFGPSWINLYGSAQNSTLNDDQQDINEGIGEGVFYRGRLLVAITVELYTSSSFQRKKKRSKKVFEKLKKNVKTKKFETSNLESEKGSRQNEQPTSIRVEVEDIHPLPEKVNGAFCNQIMSCLLNQGFSSFVIVSLPKAKVVEAAKELQENLHCDNIRQILLKAKTILKELQWWSEETQNTIPDIIIWMLSNNRHMAYTCIPARTILFSVAQQERGKDCGKIQTVFLKAPGLQNTGFGRLEIFMWFGLSKYAKNCFSALPAGYKPVYKNKPKGETETGNQIPFKLYSEGDSYDQPKLQIHNIVRGGKHAGDLLVLVELIELDYSTLGEPRIPSSIYPQELECDENYRFVLPYGIRPVLKPYNIEVLFWGLRDLKNRNILSTNQLRVNIECAGQNLESCLIENYKSKPNFQKMVNSFRVFFKHELEKEFDNFEDWLCSFPLYKGKADYYEYMDDRITGKFKGAFCISPCSEDNERLCKIIKGIPANVPVQVLVRVYVIKATNLNPADPNGKADPYITVKIGKHELSTKEYYIPKQLNPTFGELFEMTVDFPLETELTISIIDHDLVSSDDLIGETKIDLENRYYSKHYATCGLQQSYNVSGYNSWRDSRKPTQILLKLCKEHGLPEPIYLEKEVKINNAKVFDIPEDVLLQGKSTEEEDESKALYALHNWKDMPEVGFELVPEHVEMRALRKPAKPGLEQGKVYMWVDMFPKELPPPPPVDISPRKPISYELRVIIWNTDDVLLDDVNPLTGQKSSDIYVKGWIKTMDSDKQETDVHFSSLTGEGNFNWRFIFRFDFLPSEKQIIYKKKESIFSLEESEYRVAPVLMLQVWDYDLVSANDFLGAIEIDLTKMVPGAKSSSLCTINMFLEDNYQTVSIFKKKRERGWWPFVKEKEEEEDGEYEEKIETELELLTLEEAEKNPAGLGRKEPNPLEKPNRPNVSMNWLINPIKSFYFYIWRNYKKYIIAAFIMLLILAFLLLFIYTFPGSISKKLIAG
ncbi:otoferlin-like [Latimeria chalumnae]|uniref:otoferlin-like n=1 Tax=Latimeria chalumnae TaxID=7897 RepID=UPI00313E40D5